MRLEWVLVAVVGCAPVGEAERETGPAPVVVVEPGPAAAGESTPAQPEPSPDAAEQPAPKFEPTTRGSGGCVVTITALLEAEEYRGGGPMTPALEASLARDPDYARMYQSESHGDHHIQCHYEVTLAHQAGQRYRWRVVHSNTLREHTLAVCKQDLAAVAEDIVSSTKQCTDLAAGAYWGYVLEPLP